MVEKRYFLVAIFHFLYYSKFRSFWVRWMDRPSPVPCCFPIPYGPRLHRDFLSVIISIFVLFKSIIFVHLHRMITTMQSVSHPNRLQHPCRTGGRIQRRCCTRVGGGGLGAMRRPPLPGMKFQFHDAQGINEQKGGRINHTSLSSWLKKEVITDGLY